MNLKRAPLIAAIVLSPILLGAVKCGEAANDGAPEHVSGTIGLKYSPKVPTPGGDQKCTFGSFSLDTRDGVQYVCAKSQDEFDGASEGDAWSR